MIDDYRIHYNFIREHGSLATTPAVKVWIDLDLGNKKLENLIKFASKNLV